jgi:transcription initiation factor TFIIIB Brf1 subunit/transcription initiation factor TFIIB
MFEEYSWSTYPKGFSGIGAPRRSSEVKETRKTEMLKRPPFAAAVVYMACKQCDVTSSIEKILQKICRPKKIKSNAIQDAEKYYSTLLKSRLNSWRFARY